MHLTLEKLTIKCLGNKPISLNYKTNSMIKMLVGWQEFEFIPENIIEAIRANNGFQYGDGSWSMGMKTEDGRWICVTNDGGYYKVGASWSVWYNKGEDVGMQCIWSKAALKRTLKSMMEQGTRTEDPGYTT